jgi:DNA-binding LytR/AlgR family response regulator
VLFYEWRKDVLSYAVIAVTYWLFPFLAERRQAEAAAAPIADQRIEVRNGAATLYLAPADINFVEAAGNYVEVHAGAKTHLVRGTMAAWESRLTGLGFVRVHRSRLVNRAKIAAFKPTASGDLEIALLDGRTIIGSRRYRAQLAESETPAPSPK